MASRWHMWTNNGSQGEKETPVGNQKPLKPQVFWVGCDPLGRIFCSLCDHAVSLTGLKSVSAVNPERT
jgi:hypothetical protein